MTDKGFDQLILEISTQLINCHQNDFAAHIDSALQALGRFGDKDRCYVFLFNDNITSMDNVYEWVSTGISPHKDDLQNITETMLPWFFQSIKEQDYVSISDVSDLPPAATAERQEFERENIQSVLCVPMRLSGRLIGFVGCDLVNRKKDWVASDVRELQIISDMLANTIARQATETKLRAVEAELREANQRLQRQAMEDGLTGVGNRRALDERIEQELARCVRHGRLLSLMLIDVDHFKPFNDEMGHVLGDAVLQRVACEIRSSFMRHDEFVARYGGDEFMVLCAELSSVEVLQRAQRLNEKISQIEIAGINRKLTVSIGVATIRPDTMTTPEALIEIVDKATYEAKTQGRNRSHAVVMDRL